jgi:hypothetical protein
MAGSGRVASEDDEIFGPAADRLRPGSKPHLRRDDRETHVARGYYTV